VIRLLVGWAAAHVGLHDLAAEAARVVDEEVEEGYDLADRAAALVVAMLVAVMTGDEQAYARWLGKAGDVLPELDGDDAYFGRGAIAWVRELHGPSGFFAEAAGLLHAVAELGTPQSGLGNPFVIARLVLAWVGTDPQQSAGLLAEAVDMITDPADLDPFLAVAGAWVAVQADDREVALRLMTEGVEYLIREGADEPLWAALLLGAFAWIAAAGDRPAPAVMRDTADLLLPTEHRTDRTAALLALLTTLSRLLLPTG
jgi:hypothetical protein